MPETGYGSELFLRACAAAPACRAIDGRGPSAILERLRAGSLTVGRYHRSLPALEVRLTSSPAGQMIAEHLAIRERGRFRYRTAQGVLPLPADFARYLRGRHRQALRTNLGHARRAGLTVTRTVIEDWEPGLDDTRRGLLTPGPIEWWCVRGEDAEAPPVAEAIVTVDDHVALLHGLGSSGRYARWLVHTAIVEHLCGRCDVLLVNCDDAYLLGAGHRYFQRLLGYEIARLEVLGAGRGKPVAPRVRNAAAMVRMDPANT
jgi:hypothetical protein